LALHGSPRSDDDERVRQVGQSAVVHEGFSGRVALIARTVARASR